MLDHILHLLMSGRIMRVTMKDKKNEREDVEEKESFLEKLMTTKD